MLTREEYLVAPCRASSIPYWKAKHTRLPGSMKIVHDDDFVQDDRYEDETYFRLIHDLTGLTCPELPEGFVLDQAEASELAAFITGCYEHIGVSTAELLSFKERRVYDPALWLVIRDAKTGCIAASGMAELDREIGEGALEWIQVGASYRRKGLGSFIVRRLLWRMRHKARFVTVSGACGNPEHPEALYRRCGFTGDDVWHVMREK